MPEETTFTPWASILLTLCCIFTLFLPRRYAICPLLVMIGTMPLGQQLLIDQFHFPLFRVVLLMALIRVICRRERFKWNRIDTVMICWALVTMVSGMFSNGPRGPWEAFVNLSGDAYNAALSYFFVRSVIRDYEDVMIAIRTLAIVCVPLAVLMTIERTTGHNLLYVFGGVLEWDDLRNGQVRAQGAFRHPILAGSYGATCAILFGTLLFCKTRDKLLGTIGTVSALTITTAAVTSGALLSLIGGVCGLVLWKERKHLNRLRWSVVIGIVLLAAIMKQPVWFALARISGIAGGGGWHRAFIIDAAVKHFGEWWLAGTSVTAHWGGPGQIIWANPLMLDITNEFINQGVKGGILKMALFIALVVLCFKRIGTVLKSFHPRAPVSFLIWTLGCALSAQCLSMCSVAYFDQIIVLWFWLLGTISSIPLSTHEKTTVLPAAAAKRVLERDLLRREIRIGQ